MITASEVSKKPGAVQRILSPLQDRDDVRGRIRAKVCGASSSAASWDRSTRSAPSTWVATLSELEWRFNNRDNDHIFVDILRRIVKTEALPYEQLVA